MTSDTLDLRNIRGVGDRLAEKITTSFGGEEELLKAIQNFEVNRIAGIEGVSQKKAIYIINSVLGNPTEEFLKTERAFEIYQDIVNRILQFASTEYGKNRITLLGPTRDEDKIRENLNFVMKAKNTVSQVPTQEIRNLLKKINLVRDPKPKYDPAKAILVESGNDYHHLTEQGLNRYGPLITSEELENLEEFEFIIYVYSEGLMEVGDAFNVTMVNRDAEAFEIVPETVLSYFNENYALLWNILEIKNILGRESILREVLDILDSLKSFAVDESIFDEAVASAKEKADLKLKMAIKKVDLKGDEVLAILNEGMPAKIQKIFDEVINEARTEIKEKTGVSFHPFIQKYPIEVDQQELERIKKLENAKQQVKEFEEKVKAARILSKLKEKVEEEIQEILLFDYEFSLGCFAHYYDLNPPEISDGFSFKEGLHLNLALKTDKHLQNGNKIQKIDYNLEAPDNVILLTGANSGGKTTLLETLAQICIMTHMGLPVCAREAGAKLVDEVYFFSKKRSLDAGAFESFLRTFIPIVTRETDKLILLDELEAITELEAALKIISSFIDYIKDSHSYAVIVTHMAREILKYTPVRVDGIEARGLDENYNLIVDRTPRMNYFARSTPELILRMVYEKSDGKLREIYGQILEKF